MGLIVYLGQSPSLTSSNNFINYCSTMSQLTNGAQQQGQSCNPTPMGQLPSSDAIPSTKFSQPLNDDTIQENTPFNISFTGSNLGASPPVNSLTNFMAAPQQLNSNGLIIGHYHLVVESLTSFSQTAFTNPSQFSFFKEVFDPTVPTQMAGLSAGFYRASVSVHATNHQPIIPPVSQHGSTGDAVYVRFLLSQI